MMKLLAITLCFIMDVPNRFMSKLLPTVAAPVFLGKTLLCHLLGVNLSQLLWLFINAPQVLA